MVKCRWSNRSSGITLSKRCTATRRWSSIRMKATSSTRPPMPATIRCECWVGSTSGSPKPRTRAKPGRQPGESKGGSATRAPAPRSLRLKPHLSRIDRHSNHCVNFYGVQLRDLLSGGNSAGDDQLPACGFSQLPNRVQRNASHQAFRVDMRIQKRTAPFLKRGHHFHGSDCCQLPPPPNRNAPLLRIDRKNKSFRPNGPRRLLPENQNGPPPADQRRSKNHAQRARSQHLFRIPHGAQASANLARKTFCKFAD